MLQWFTRCIGLHVALGAQWLSQLLQTVVDGAQIHQNVCLHDQPGVEPWYTGIKEDSGSWQAPLICLCDHKRG